MIFDIESRLPNALILGFSGYRHEVHPIVQNLSHATRAYIVNSSGLPGFVAKPGVMQVLEQADKEGDLDHVKEWQVIDLNLIKGELEEKENTSEKMQVLKQNYPGLYVYMLKFFDK